MKYNLKYFEDMEIKEITMERHLFSRPLIWLNRNRKVIILTLHRCATITLNHKLEKFYEKIKSQYELKEIILNEIKDDIENYKFYIFVKNPYDRLNGLISGMFFTNFWKDLHEYPFEYNVISDKRNNENNAGWKPLKNTLDYLFNEEQLKFITFLRNNKYSEEDYLKGIEIINDVYGKYFINQKDYVENDNYIKVNCIDTHMLPQTFDLLYNKKLLDICNVIKLEKTNMFNENQIINNIIGIKMERIHPTVYHINKKIVMKNKTFINLVNKYYENDIKYFNYEVLL